MIRLFLVPVTRVFNIVRIFFGSFVTDFLGRSCIFFFVEATNRGCMVHSKIVTYRFAQLCFFCFRVQFFFVRVTIFWPIKIFNILHFFIYCFVNYSNHLLVIIFQVIVINDQFPGPLLNATTNEVVNVNVHNNLTEPFLITWYIIHSSLIVMI